MVGEQIINVIRKAVGDEDPMEGLSGANDASELPPNEEELLKRDQQAVISGVTDLCKWDPS